MHQMHASKWPLRSYIIIHIVGIVAEWLECSSQTLKPYRSRTGGSRDSPLSPGRAEKPKTTSTDRTTRATVTEPLVITNMLLYDS